MELDLNRIIDELQAELAAVNEAIRALEVLATKRSGGRQGRPPKWLAEARVRNKAANESADDE